jgi:hypothetical protein
MMRKPPYTHRQFHQFALDMASPFVIWPIDWHRAIIIFKKQKKKTPWRRLLPEKLKHPKPLEKFSAFYETRRFITAFTRPRHLSLS